MPILLPTIDEIAEAKQRLVLLLSFPSNGSTYQNNMMRQRIIKWLETSGIPFEECGNDPSLSGRSSYSGELFVDVVCDPSDEKFSELKNFLLIDGDKPRFKWVVLSFHKLHR